MTILLVNKYTFWSTVQKGVILEHVDLQKHTRRFGFWFYRENNLPIFPKNKGMIEILQK